jgi:hypothetical protein
MPKLKRLSVIFGMLWYNHLQFHINDDIVVAKVAKTESCYQYSGVLFNWLWPFLSLRISLYLVVHVGLNHEQASSLPWATIADDTTSYLNNRRLRSI